MAQHIDIAPLVAWAQPYINQAHGLPHTVPAEPGHAVHAVVAELDTALRHHGLFIATGLSRLAGDKAALFAAARDFFAQPETAKLRCRAAEDRPGFFRGYLPFGSESGRPEAFFEPKEGFRLVQDLSSLSLSLCDYLVFRLSDFSHSYGYAWPEDEAPQNALQGPNRWPDQIVASSAEDHSARVDAAVQSGGDTAEAQAAAFRRRLLDLYDQFLMVAKALVCGIALALDRSPLELLHHCDGGDSISLVRLFHYLPADPARASMGSSPHTDWGFLTLIAQDDVGGLEYQHEGRWVDVAPTSRSDQHFVVNGGDALRLMSRGRYISPVHRVLCPQQRDRLSFVFFYYPSYDAALDADAWQAANAVDDQGQAAAGPDFNTLLVGVKPDASGKLPSFGDCIVQKWAGVRRSAY